ncbi:hypothetical protein OF001_U90083 [Pseudomonas sp. OF001]|nr:hypothetical protein OF001_U90083 [Pseudomonas sp. OF001]
MVIGEVCKLARHSADVACEIKRWSVDRGGATLASRVGKTGRRSSPATGTGPTRQGEAF